MTRRWLWGCGHSGFIREIPVGELCEEGLQLGHQVVVLFEDTEVFAEIVEIPDEGLVKKGTLMNWSLKMYW